MQTLATAMADANNQQAEWELGEHSQAFNICAFEIQSIIGSKVKQMLKDYVYRKYEREANEAMGDPGTEPVEDSNEFRKWLWVYFNITDTCVAWTGAKCNLETYLKYDANKYTKKMVEAQMKGHKKDVATYHRLKEVSLGDAERLLAEAGNVELDHRYPEGFYDAMVDVVDSSLTDIESKSYANKDADVVFLKGLRAEMGG